MVRLLFTSSSDTISAAIRLLSGEASHVGVQVRRGRDHGGDVMSAEWPKVIAQPLSGFLEGRELVAAFEATPAGEPHLMVSRARAHLGDPYALNEVPGFAYVAFVEAVLGKKVRNPVHDPGATVCSEFVLYLDDETGFVTEFMDLDPETTHPGVLLERLRKGGPTFTPCDLGRVLRGD